MADFKTKLIFLLFFFIYLPVHFLNADSYKGASEDEAVVMRVPVWVFLEPQPGTMSKEERGRLMPPIKALKELSQFILSGMTYGWSFSYTPSDKKRAVAEAFEFKPFYEIKDPDTRLSITEVRAKYPYLYCWAEYRISEAEALRREQWKGISFKTTKGRGTAGRKEEISGVYNAYTEAAKAAVKSYAKKIEKNKPKEITGDLLIKENPRLFVESGRFIAELELYIKIKDIIPYSVF